MDEEGELVDVLQYRGMATDAVGKKYMQSLVQQAVNCPYCGEAIDVLIDHQDAGDQYIEDCQVCCRPITFSVSVDPSGHLSVSVRDENDAY